MTKVVARDLPGLAELPKWDPGKFCQTCANPGVSGTYCAACTQYAIQRNAGVGMADQVVPLTYAWWGTQIWNDVYNYKKPDEAVSRDGLKRLQKLGWWGSIVHGACIDALSEDEHPLLVTVPSTQGRLPPHPIERVAALLPESWARTTAHLTKLVGRTFDADAFAFDDPRLLAGRHVIVFDDTWATGARAQSLASAAKLCGATWVTVLVLANHLDHRSWTPLSKFRRRNPSLDWSVELCPVRGVVCRASLDLTTL